jgi:hypothetical protein
MKRQHLTSKILSGAIMALSALALTATSSLAAKDDFQITNNSRIPIAELYLTESSISYWGSDLLGYDLLYRGESRPIDFGNPSPYACLYDMRVVFASGFVHKVYQVDVCSINEYMFYDP